VLSDPQGQIIDKGDLFLCQTQCHYWYSFSYKIDDSTFELSKMAVTDGARIRMEQNAKPLYNICPRKKWDKLILYSNRKLVSAIHFMKNLVLLKFPWRVYMKELISKWSELSSEITKLEINSTKLKILKLCVN
jgi:hypothetical protein